MNNRLAAAISPYLLQHAANPVDWQPWSAEAFAEAKSRDVPIFLSIGYAACHWCHVMAHESFEDEQTAAFLNEHFVCIKVDREERPDVDAVYMQATTALTGHGGWPMSVFLDERGRPFYAGTYFPPSARGGMPSFMQLLGAISASWRERRHEVLSAAERIAAALKQEPVSPPGPSNVTNEFELSDYEALSANSVKLLATQYDEQFAGFGSAPKFPPSMVLQFLILYHQRTNDPQALSMASKTAEAMARGGIYDQLGGGFARYSVDTAWVVPHFEKMLYDNGLLLEFYANLYSVTKSELALRVTKDTAQFLIDELTTNEGGFASSLDADTEGQEGLFYVWNIEQLILALGEDDGHWAASVFGVTENGNFEFNTSTLTLTKTPNDISRFSRVRSKLLAARIERTNPGRDEKVVASWNAMAISGLLAAYRVTDDVNHLSAAVRAAELLSEVHLFADDENRLLVKRVSRDGKAGEPAGVLEDYSLLAGAFFTLTDVTGDPKWRLMADDLLRTIFVDFADGGDVPTLFDTSSRSEKLFKRPRDLTDNATPSGNAATALALFGSNTQAHLASALLAVGVPVVRSSPRFGGSWLCAFESYLGKMPRSDLRDEISTLGLPLTGDATVCTEAGCD